MTLKNLFGLLALAGGAVFMSGCTTVAIYQSPVSRFQTSVNSANNGIRTYLLGINDIVARSHLYAEYGSSDTPVWAPKDLTGGIPDQEIQLRLQALATISAYANALGAMAESEDVANLQQAAKTLGSNVNTLSATLQSIDPRSKWYVDLGDPASSLVTMFGTAAIEHQQKAALEQAIINGSTNVDAIIDKLKLDAPLFSTVVAESENVLWAGKFRNYNKILKTTGPNGVDALITQCLADYDSIQSLKNAQMASLLDDMENTHKALVVFAQSSKSPKDLSDLAGQIDVFAAHVQLFNNALSSIQSTINSSK